MRSAPCKPCTKHTADCHGKCKDYRTWSAERQAMLREAQKQREVDDFQIASMYKTKKRRDRR